MEATAARSQLIAEQPARSEGGVRFEIATRKHDAALRRLLRDNPMPGPMSGQIRLSLEREPSYFDAATAVDGAGHRTIVALEGDRVIGAGSISERRRFINGKPMRVGYLGGLRLDSGYRGQASIIRRGYEFFHRLHKQGGPPIYLTSIVADNMRAIRLLERGLPGMPAYRFLGEFVSLMTRVPKRENNLASDLSGASSSSSKPRIVEVREPTPGNLVDLINLDHQRYQFAPVWSAEELVASHFRVACGEDGEPMACAALWDQRAFKQAVVRGYEQPLRWARPLINIAAAFFSTPRLPRVGECVSQAFVSHLALNPDQDAHKDEELLVRLIRALENAAAARGIEYLTLGFDARDPRLARLREAFRPREFSSRLYVVHWSDGADLAESLDDRIMAPEVALL
jgi:hypothetical protein